MSKESRKLRLSDDAASLVGSLHPELKRKMKAALRLILDTPDSGKALKYELSGLRSFRVGKFRIIYRVPSKAVIHVLAVGSRKTIYEETLRFVHAKRK
jgi:mRNA interferase RelE/StbE